MTTASDTIFALSSGSVPSGVAVIRLSGPRAFDAANALVAGLPRRRDMVLRSIRSRNGSLIDRGLVLTFPSPASFTGEDCIEFQVHGGRAVVQAIADALKGEGLRPAEAGEFTQRAFDNGKLDLVEVEGLGDLISADTEMQRRLAIEQSAGGLSRRYADWAERLTRCRALIEAELDFADEDDVPGSVSDQVWSVVDQVRREIDSQSDATLRASAFRDAFKVVILGAPNAGKSSLLNAFARRDVAIVTEIAGTTRDVLEVDLDWDGFLVRLSDTAGLRESQDQVEQEGIRRAKRAAAEADLVLLLRSVDSVPEQPAFGSDAPPILRIWSKADLDVPPQEEMDAVISVESGQGLDDLRQLILEHVKREWTAISALGAGRMRHQGHLQNASLYLQDALKGDQVDLRAESLRLAADCFGRITGRVDVEDLLDVIFSEFCIGK